MNKDRSVIHYRDTIELPEAAELFIEGFTQVLDLVVDLEITSSYYEGRECRGIRKVYATNGPNTPQLDITQLLDKDSMAGVYQAVVGKLNEEEAVL